MADDLGVQYTDAKVAALEKKLNKEYKQAQKDIKKKLDDFTAKSAAKEQVYLQKVKNGTMTQEQFDHWKQGQVFYGENWKAQQESIAKVLADTNTVATNMINGEKADVFAFNGNYTAYQFEHGFGADFGFDLYSEKSVEHLLKDNPQILPKKKLDKSKDVAWNMRNIRSQITQGIIQGESIPKIAERLANVVPDRNKKQMVMHARTAMTAAQNSGRMERFKEAEKLGIKFKKLWIATLDNRTRDSHQDLDGETAKPDEPFVLGKIKIMYPGDPKADPSEVYNCRCTLGTELEDYPAKFDRRAKGDDGKYRNVGDMSYKEWAKQKAQTQAPAQAIQQSVPKTPKPLRELKKLKKAMSGKDYEAYHDMVENNELVSGLYDRHADEVQDVRYVRGGGSYGKYTGVQFSYADGDQDRFSTLAHEYGHAFDDVARGDFAVSYGEVRKLNEKCKKGTYGYSPFKETPSQSDEYLTALRKDKEIIRQAIKDPDVRKALNADDASAGVQDLADGLFATQDSSQFHLRWGHGNQYYNRAYNKRIKGMGVEKELKEGMLELGLDASNQAKVKNLCRTYEASSELWANQMSAITVGGKELEHMEKYTPNTLKVLKDLLKGAK